MLSRWEVMKHGIRVFDLKLWLLVLVYVFRVQCSLAQHGEATAPPAPMAAGYGLLDYKFSFVHNQTRIARARAQAAAHGDGAATEDTSAAAFPVLSWAETRSVGSRWDDALQFDPQVFGGWTWYSPNVEVDLSVEFLAVDGVTYREFADFGNESVRISSARWRPPIQRVRNASPGAQFVEVLVSVHAAGLAILGEGVYFPSTGMVHLVGCTREVEIPRKALESEAGGKFEWTYPEGAQALNLTDFESEHMSWRCRQRVDRAYGFLEQEDAEAEFHGSRCPGGEAYFTRSSGVCDLSVTIQYPPLGARWNWQRVLKLTIQSSRSKHDPRYVHPVERTIFYPYHFHRGSDALFIQKEVETGGRMFLLLLGLACVGLQIRHGRNNEEALPFVSLAMLGIQIANHVSQTSVFKDLQIQRFGIVENDVLLAHSQANHTNMFFDRSVYSPEDFNYYGIMALHEYVPYQTMAVAAIFMYVWIFHRVGDRRRVMQLRVRKGKVGARPPPRDGPLVFATLTILCVVGLFGITAYGVDYYNVFGTAASDAFPGALGFRFHNLTGARAPELARVAGDYDEFVSPEFYRLSEAQWGFLNKLTGLVVSLFLMPQLLGNWRWEVQGRPLSAWFYMGLPFLQSLPHIFDIAKHFQLLPIFAFYDPYCDSLYGFYANPVPSWQIGVVVTTALLVVAVHLQLTASFNPWRRQPTAGAPLEDQTCDVL